MYKKLKTKNCLFCNKEFFYCHDTAKYCSIKCRNDYKAKTGVYLNFRRSSIKNTLLTVLWGARSRSKRLKRDFSITDEQILELFDKQNGKCAMTGIIMEPAKQHGTKDKNPFTVSINRMDNSKGYVIDNVQLVCTICNLFKNSYDIETVTKICREFIKYNNVNIYE